MARKKCTTNHNGVVLQETQDTVVIATGIKDESVNSKTGGMIQVYILYRHESPIDAIRSGRDETICMDCIHRGGRGKKRRCYVQVGKAPLGIWRCYARGRYRHATQAEHVSLFGGRIVRFGAYGDPAVISESIVSAICSVAKAWTGYTHQWRKYEYAWLRNYVMASCDSPQDAHDAIAMGWRYFRVAPKGDGTKLPGEISCPASAEAGKLTTCDKCKLCSGRKANDPRKNIVIQDHSTIAKSQPLVQIMAAA